MLILLQCGILLAYWFTCSGIRAEDEVYEPDSVADKQPAGWEHRQEYPMPVKGESARRIALFREMESLRDSEESEKIYRYRLFVPKEAKEAELQEKFPLLVWLHGYGESGSDNWRQLIYIRDEVAKWESTKGGFPCFVLAPQSPYENHWGREIEKLVMQLVERTIADFPIDASRIYLAGVSSGGNATWRIGAHHPGMFAALVPMASASVGIDVAALAKTPAWTFRSVDDPLAPNEGFLRKVAGIRSQGGHCWLTELPGRNHDCWTAAFNDYHLIDWLLLQRRGEPAVPIPWWAGLKSFHSRHLTWVQVWPTLAVMIVVAGLVWAVRRHLQRCKNVASAGERS